MKRPEGFDPAPAPSRTAVRDRPKKAEKAERAEHTGRAASSERAARSERVEPAEPRRRAPRLRRAERAEAAALRSAARSTGAKAELRAAQRARKQAERAEMRRFTRASRYRRTVWIVALATVAAVAGIVVLAVFSPALALRTIEIEGAERLDEAEVAAALEGELGRPLALIDEARIADELGDFALIRSFVVELVPPGTMRVRIEERQPVGVVVSGSEFQLVDPAGIVVDTSETRPDGVPLIELPTGDEGVVRRAIAEVLLALPAEVLERVDRITATTRDDVAFTMRGSDQRVVWGSAENSERKALVLAALLEKWGGKGAGEYDVAGSGSATFRQL